mmetsp:Transcript_65471/g.175579  ORF Transcript_65471/g.175579 Transcript_65471/m.175579 type:complete len:86 (-) Transcript_65471:112-369(-)
MERKQALSEKGSMVVALAQTKLEEEYSIEHKTATRILFVSSKSVVERHAQATAAGRLDTMKPTLHAISLELDERNASRPSIATSG